MTTELFRHQATTIPCQQGDYPEWHLGRTRYGLWALEVDATAVLERFYQAQQALADYLLPGYQRQPHVTLYVCGFLDWLEPQQPQANDNFSKQQLAQQRTQLATTLEQFRNSGQGITLAVGGVDSFSSAPYLRIDDPQQQLARLRAACKVQEAENDLPLKQRGLSAQANEFRSHPYTPHLTLGLYRDAFSCHTLSQAFDRINQRHNFETELPLPVTALHFMSYGSHCVGSPLCRELSLPV